MALVLCDVFFNLVVLYSLLCVMLPGRYWGDVCISWVKALAKCGTGLNTAVWSDADVPAGTGCKPIGPYRNPLISQLEFQN
jgi:hypothetical protein